ncbi:triose-phosphate isomerase [Limosilactobacillus sp.]|uniref:triose-phosphate isomerase n=1 Tax=Limosilactobacillus sp. TaxID=2773925 RepID=UPI00345F11A0
MSREPVVGFSLKNYINTIEDNAALVRELNRRCGQESGVEQFLLPSLGTIENTAQILLDNNSQIGFGAQNVGPAANGAWTGEYSIETLASLHGSYVEVGHHERLLYFHEDAGMINRKLKLVLQFEMTPVLCIGEGQRKLSPADFSDRIHRLLERYLCGIDVETVGKMIIAYEPGWAIGQRTAANPQFVHQAMASIRRSLAQLTSPLIADQVRLIYGGSVSKLSTPAIVDDDNTDGIFVGRFGHDPANYQAMLDEVKKAKMK